MKKAPDLPQRKKSNEAKQEIRSNVVIEEEHEQDEIEDDIDYESDFDSISLGNSLIRSRHSLRSSSYLNSQRKIEES